MEEVIFTNPDWANLYNTFIKECEADDTYKEALSVNFVVPLFGIASQNKAVFDPEKAAAMYFWYKMADRNDNSIIKYFPEYERCIDEKHQYFNSNYGQYASAGLNRCVYTLLADKNSRQACFMINNEKAMDLNEIDKLCTNAVMFFIRDNKLRMVVQMRSSNMLTLLPYDAFIFSVWYARVYNHLIRKYIDLMATDIEMQVASLHFYQSDYDKKILCKEKTGINTMFSFADICDHNFEFILEEKLAKFLKSS